MEGINNRSSTKKKMRVAVIGTGISGETIAYFLHSNNNSRKSEEEVEEDQPPVQYELAAIYESKSEPGLHYNSINLELTSEDNEFGGGEKKRSQTTKSVPVDVPVRAVSHHYYPNLVSLYEHLNVPLTDVNYSNSHINYETNNAFFRYRNLMIFGYAFPYITFSDAKQLLVAFRIIRDLFWLMLTGPYHLYHYKHSLSTASVDDDSTSESKHGKSKEKKTFSTFESYLKDQRFSFEFTDCFFLPLFSTLLSCSYLDVLNYPWDYILEFCVARSTCLFTGWMRAQRGVEEVSDRLLHDIKRDCPDVLRFCTMVESVESLPDGRVKVTSSACSSGKESDVETAGGEDNKKKKKKSKSRKEKKDSPSSCVDYFDIVVIATEPKIAEKLWIGKDKEEAALFESISEYIARITVHKDASLLPDKEEDWRSFNIYSTPTSLKTGGRRGAEEGDDDDDDDEDVYSIIKTKGRRNASMTSSPLHFFNTDIAEHLEEKKKKKRNTAVKVDDHHSTFPRHVSSTPCFIETWNAYHNPKEIVSDTTLSRAVWTSEGAIEFNRMFGKVQGKRRIYLIGAYSVPGVTLLEQAVTSALEVAVHDLGLRIPFVMQERYEASGWIFVLAHFLVWWKFILFFLIAAVAFFLR